MTKVPYRHFVPLRLRGGRAPFVAMRHFPRFSGGIYPEGGSKISRHSERSEESHRRTDGHILLTCVVGYFVTLNMTKVPYRHFVPLPPKEEAKSHVILNEVKNPTEELTGIYSSLVSWDISLRSI